MDPNTAMETIGAGAKAATKFGEIIEKIFGPRWTRKQADADAYSDQRKLQTIRENPDMEIVYVNGQLNARERSPEAFAYRAEQRMLADATREESNIENVLEAASKELQQVESVSDEPVDDDWITRFFSIVKDISNEDMHLIWGKILAGEITKPNSFSFRTLDAVRNLSQLEATTFQKVLPIVLRHGENAFICSEELLFEKYGINYHDIMVLDECGLMVQNSMISLNFDISNDSEAIIYTDDYMMKIEGLSSEKSKLSIGVYGLTCAGYELYRILSHQTELQFFTDFADYIFEKNKKEIKIDVYKVNRITDDSIDYQLSPIKSYRSLVATIE